MNNVCLIPVITSGYLNLRVNKILKGPAGDYNHTIFLVLTSSNTSAGRVSSLPFKPFTYATLHFKRYKRFSCSDSSTLRLSKIGSIETFGGCKIFCAVVVNEQNISEPEREKERDQYFLD